MTPEPAYRVAIREYIAREAKPVDKFGHQPRLYELARQVGQGSEFDDDVVYAAAWLHDLGVFTGHRPENLAELARWDNVRYAMDHAPRVLRECAFPETKIAAVIEAIRTHQPSRTPETLEGAILRDSDILEQLGAMGILRMVSKVGRDTRYPTFTAAVATLKTALATLPGQLRLETARDLAEPRILAMRAFLTAVEQESQGALF